MNVIIFFCLLGFALAAPPASTDYKSAETLLYENVNTGFGPFRFAYEQSDGTKHEQQGEVVDEGRENQRLVVKGKYSYVAPDGVVHVVKYVADENGYHPEIEKGEVERKLPQGFSGGPGAIASLLG